MSSAYGEETAKRYGGSWIRKEDRQALYERDSWTCQLCGGGVDPEVHPNDKWSPTIDHIVHRSKTENGEPDNSWENLRLAHRSCNSKRHTSDDVTDEELTAMEDSVLAAANTGSRLEGLRALRTALSRALDTCESKRDIAALSARLSDVLQQIDELQPSEDAGDAIDELKRKRAARRSG